MKTSVSTGGKTETHAPDSHSSISLFLFLTFSSTHLALLRSATVFNSVCHAALCRKNSLATSAFLSCTSFLLNASLHTLSALLALHFSPTSSAVLPISSFCTLTSFH
jgi:hypothetical protein